MGCKQMLLAEVHGAPPCALCILAWTQAQYKGELELGVAAGHELFCKLFGFLQPSAW